MGLKDWIKNLIPDITYNDNKTVNNINIKDSGIYLDDKKVGGKKEVDKFLASLSDDAKSDGYPAQIIHKDLKEGYRAYEDISIKEQKSIAKLREVLPEEEIECILMARRVMFSYDSGNKKSAMKLHDGLREAFPSKGNSVFNLLSAGYFDEIILPFVDVYKEQFGEDYIEKYRHFYDDIIRYFPLAFFIGNNTSLDDVRNVVGSRLIQDIPFFRLHAMGKNNIQKIDDIVDELDIETKYRTKRHTFPSSSGLMACTFEISFK